MDRDYNKFKCIAMHRLPEASEKYEGYVCIVRKDGEYICSKNDNGKYEWRIVTSYKNIVDTIQKNSDNTNHGVSITDIAKLYNRIDELQNKIDLIESKVIVNQRISSFYFIAVMIVYIISKNYI